MTELHIEIDNFSFEKALYSCSLAKVKSAGFLYSDISLTEKKIFETKKILKELALIYDIEIFLGFKISFVPPALIDEYTKRQREKSFDYICVDGENIYNNRPQGTNFAALNANVDILLNPGFIDDTLMEYAKEKKTAFEFNTHPKNTSANALLADYAVKDKYNELLILWGNTIQCEKDFIYSHYRSDCAKVSLKQKANDLIKKLNQDTNTFIQNMKKSF